MHFSELQQTIYNLSTSCHICKKEIKDDQIAVRDHCHKTGNFRGKAHQGCNLNYKNKFDIPLFAHNSVHYDQQYLIKDIVNALPGKTHVISQTMETYLAVYKNIEDSRIRYVFLDSFKFLNSSLDNLVSLLDRNNDFDILKSIYTENLDLLMQKSFYPYEYIDSIEKFSQTTLPEKEFFYSSLTNSHISEENYEHAKKVWNSCLGEEKSLLNYTLFYNKLDVILLATVFEKFRNTCMLNFELDPTSYISLASFSFDAMLRMTGANIELLTNVDMFLFCEKSVRGGITEVLTRYARCNNKYVPESFNPNKESSYLMGFDVNSMYATVMQEKLPIDDFKFLKK